eukprot:TRINITY_DN10027_c0_g1_i1.p1 TRINITY_DN10027_c0_g1~~TRINITY_DN10027_c0_g1_i1.p1  ORF type:complete len:886 (+),score=279.90 TRINITY_DN10027_c0_g1_i1:296-2953(+)
MARRSADLTQIARAISTTFRSSDPCLASAPTRTKGNFYNRDNRQSWDKLEPAACVSLALSCAGNSVAKPSRLHFFPSAAMIRSSQMSKLRLLSFLNWGYDETKSCHVKRVVQFANCTSAFSVLTILMNKLFFAWNDIELPYFLSFFLCKLTLILISVPLLNKFGWHMTAITVQYFASLAAVGAASLWTGYAAGIELYLSCIALGAVLLIEPDDHRNRFIFVGLTMLTKAALFIFRDSGPPVAPDLVTSLYAINTCGAFCCVVVAAWIPMSERGLTEKERPEQTAAAQVLSSNSPSLSDSNAARERQTAEAEAAVEARESALAMMSHEIRTPLNGVIGLIELLTLTNLNSDQQGIATLIEQSSRNLVSIVSNVLDYSKLNASKVVLEEICFDPEEVVEDTVAAISAAMTSTQVELICDVDPAVPRTVLGDRLRLQQIVTNLVSNALKFTKRGHVVVRLSALLLEDDVVRMRLEVEDSGIGLTEEQAASLFRPFQQATPSTSRRYGGSGLGLAICKMLVTALGGEIGVNGKVNQGSTFWVELPMRAARGQLPQRSPSFPQSDTPEDIDLRQVLHESGGQADTVLIVDRSHLHQRALSHATMRLKMPSVAFPSAGQALEAARHNRNTIALVLLDETTLLLDDESTAEEVLSQWSQLGLAVIVMRPSLEQMISGDDLLAAQGVVGSYVARPVRRAALQSAIASALRLGSAPAKGSTAAVVECSASSGELAFDPSAHRLLVAEDNIVNQTVIKRMLMNLGYPHDIVSNGREAVEWLRQGNYSMLLLDLQMPVMDGYEAARVIRKLEEATEMAGFRHQRAIILALTASTEQSIRDRCQAAGFNDFLSKPIQAATLRDKLANLLRPDARGLTRRSSIRRTASNPDLDIGPAC